MSERRREAATLILLALVPAILFADVLLGRNAFFARDVMHYYFPAKKVLREIVLSGHFPHWNPMFSAGQPMAANPEHEVFYPLTWLILLPDYVHALQLLALLHVFIGTFTMYALLRSMNTGRPAACFGAFSFGIGGLLASLLTLYPCLFSIAWLPLTCLFTRRFLLHRRPRDFAAAGFFLGLQLLVGEPVTALVSGLLLGSYALYRGEWRGAPRRVGIIALISVAALLFAAVQVLPAFDHLGDTGRGEGMSYDTIKIWSTPPIRFAELLYPRILGRFDAVGSSAYWGAELYPSKQTGFFYSIYCGLAIAVLAIAGVFARVRGWTLFVSVTAAAFLIAAGDFTPLLRFLYDIDVATKVRFPEKFLMMALFAVILFGTRVLDALLRGDARTRKAALTVTIVVAAAAVTAAMLTTTSGYAAVFRNLFRIKGPVEESLAIARVEWLIAALRAVPLLLLLATVTRLRRPLWLALAFAFVIADLGVPLNDIAVRIPFSFFTETPPSVRGFPAQRDGFRIFHLAEWMESSPRARFYRRPSAEYFWVRRNALSPKLPAAYGLRTVIDGDFDETNLRPERDFTAAMFELAAKRPRDWLDIATSMSNVRYLGIYRRPEEALAQAKGWNRDVVPVQFLEGRMNPRYYFASEVVRIGGREEFVRQLSTKRFTREVAFISEAAFAPARGVIHAQREWPNGARLDVEAFGRAFFVASVTPHKYWRLTIDGRETPAVVTNIGYQGVVVPPGRHVVEMRYRNPLIAVGAGITALALILLVWLSRR